MTHAVTVSAPRPVFPFSAVLGQERLKLALLLCAIDPGIGGVLVRGPRGVAKTTLARGFADLLPGRFVELPLGASEERVTGSLDLGKALGQGEVRFAPGLLAHAHDGVLYVDEVNLLPDALVDLLLDAAATGHNVVERDGFSHAHPARFVLIGTMNPEEGELRPQLVDRFGLSVAAGAVLSPADRSAVVLRRLDFERDPRAFAASFEREQGAVIERCRAARERAPTLPFAGPATAHAAELCHAAGVEGVRADLAMLRAARAHAAWHERDAIAVSDVDAVAELALAHRRRGGQGGSPRGTPPTGATEPSGSGGSSGASDRAGSRDASSSALRPSQTMHEQSPTEAASSARVPASGSSGGGQRDGASAPSGSAGSPQRPRRVLPPVPVRSLVPPSLPGWFFMPEPPTATARPSFQRRVRGRRDAGEGAIDWFATLAHRRHPTLKDVRRRPRRLARGGTWVIALDCSASMLQRGALGYAKGAARALAAKAARGRAHVVLLSFGGVEARLEAGARGALATVEHAIASLGASGATPLRRAVQLGLRLASSAPASGERRFVLFTDGRSRDDMSGLVAAHPAVEATLVDCERGVVRLGRARGVAQQLGARYVHVDELWASAPDPALAQAGLGGARP